MTVRAWRTAFARLPRRAALLLALIAATVSPPAGAQVGPFAEAAVKAAYLYHFATFVTWPPRPAPAGALTIAVLDDVEVFGELERFLPGRTIDGMAVSARLVRSMDEVERWEMLYVGATDNRTLDRLLAEVIPGEAGRLVVTDSPGGIRRGAAINFIRLEDRIRFEIDRDAIARSGLQVSSRLLDAAYLVVDEP